MSVFRYLQVKKSQISVQVAWGDHTIFISQTNDICFTLNIKYIGKKKILVPYRNVLFELNISTSLKVILFPKFFFRKNPIFRLKNL